MRRLQSTQPELKITGKSRFFCQKIREKFVKISLNSRPGCVSGHGCWPSARLGTRSEFLIIFRPNSTRFSEYSPDFRQNSCGNPKTIFFLIFRHVLTVISSDFRGIFGGFWPKCLIFRRIFSGPFSHMFDAMFIPRITVHPISFLTFRPTFSDFTRHFRQDFADFRRFYCRTEKSTKHTRNFLSRYPNLAKFPEFSRIFPRFSPILCDNISAKLFFFFGR
jgi:hypothetical protein